MGIGIGGQRTTSIMASSAAAGFLGRGSSGNNSNMRGLVQFIADLRNARARELEEKRINKELANIRFVPLPSLQPPFECHWLTCLILQAKVQRYTSAGSSETV